MYDIIDEIAPFIKKLPIETKLDFMKTYLQLSDIKFIRVSVTVTTLTLAKTTLGVAITEVNPKYLKTNTGTTIFLKDAFGLSIQQPKHVISILAYHLGIFTNMAL